METFGDLEQAVSRALASKRIGIPVAARGFFQVSPDHGALLAVLESAVAASAVWFGSGVRRVYALGGARHGEITVTVEFAAGQTALVSAAVLRDPAPLADLLLLGNRGTLRFQEPAALRPEGAHPALRAAIERSLASGQPVEVTP